jgi:PERQ amino acid-rich with GYF domain-containing protein
LLEQQKKAKVLEQQRREANRIQETQKSVKQPPSSAWQVNNNAIAQQQGLSLAEIQKLERERRAAEKKLELQHQMKLQQQAQQQLLEQQQKENILKWNAQPIQPTNIKSFEEIQAEEIAKQTAAERKREREMAKLNKDNEKLQTSIWNSHAAYNNLVWNSDANQQTSSAGFWEEPTKPTPVPNNNNNVKNNPQKLSKSQTMGNIVTNKTAAAIVAQSAQPKQQQQQQQGQQKSQHQTQKAKSATNVPGGQQHQHNSQSFAAAASANQHNNNKKIHNNEGKHNNKNNGGGHNGGGSDKNFNEFTEWCMKTLSAIEIKVVDGEFLR